MRLKLLFCIFLLNSCVQDHQFKYIEPYFILHENTSKVWLINHLYEDGQEKSALSLKYKQILVFHNSGNCYQYDIQNLGDKPGKKGSFFLLHKSKYLRIKFEKETWDFRVKKLNENKIILSPRKNSKKKYKIELIPFPEF